MRKSKVIVVLLLLFAALICVNSSHTFHKVHAIDGDVTKNYVIYDEQNNYLFEKSQVSVGDFYINKSYQKYEVVYLNETNKTGVARFVEQLTKPKVKISPTPSPISAGEKNIGLYCSHNDESYLPTEGYYTIYGKGGIHDVAKKLKTTFETMGINAPFNETLHLPHDGGAYTRSAVTAKKLLNENKLNALFDIHRDGIARSYYATTVNGQERSKIRIVVGKANANMKANESFALYLSAVADELYPWLISDIYYATGHYNQNLFEKALLFEMGTYLIEKELVLSSVEPLAHVINVTLFNTTVNQESGELEIGGNETATTPIIDNAIGNNQNISTQGLTYVAYIAVIYLAILSVTEIFILIYLHFIKKRFIK